MALAGRRPTGAGRFVRHTNRCDHVANVGKLFFRLTDLLKKPGGRQSEQQKNYEAMLGSLGAIYILAYSVEDVRKRLTEEFSEHEWQ